MKNFPVKVDGKEYWISRSVAVCTFVFKIKGNELFTLVQRRGKGAADEQGKLCASSGYLEWSEQLCDASVRELQEECGFIANKDRLQFMGINSDPNEAHQNITVRYVYFAKKNEDFDLKKAIGGEKDEVSEVKWFKVGEFNKPIKNSQVLFSQNLYLKVNIYDIISEDWAFGHDKIMIEHLSTFFKLRYDEKEKENESD